MATPRSVTLKVCPTSGPMVQSSDSRAGPSIPSKHEGQAGSVAALECECCLYSFIHRAQLGIFQHVADGSALVPPFIKDLLAKQDVMPFGVAALLRHQGVDPVAPRDGGAFLALDVGRVHLA